MCRDSIESDCEIFFRRVSSLFRLFFSKGERVGSHDLFMKLCRDSRFVEIESEQLTSKHHAMTFMKLQETISESNLCMLESSLRKTLESTAATKRKVKQKDERKTRRKETCDLLFFSLRSFVDVFECVSALRKVSFRELLSSL